MCLIGPSSLNNTIKLIPYQERKQFFGRSYTISGLSLNEKAKNKLKILQKLLEQGTLRRVRKIVLWHDTINKSISPNRSNNNKPCSIPEHINTLLKLRPRIAGIVSCQRAGTKNILKDPKKRHQSLSSM